ncbi:MAG: ABC transporter substrate-binding protein [Ruminiclostridium sp.]|nr:ABC transporter substrate-binding protein [Ruminiclostridium sp.]
MKKETVRITSALTAALLLLGTGCANNAPAATTTTTAAATTTTAAAETTTTEDTEAAVTEAKGEPEASDTAEVNSVDADTGEVEEEVLEIGYDAPDTVRVAALKGPTAMGMIKLMDDSDNDDESIYDFEIFAAPDELTPLVIKGDIDIACIPANLASVLYNKTEGAVEVLAVNTLGVLYIVENGGETVNSVEDLKGKTLYASGQGSTPEYALNYILSQNGIADEVNIEWKTEHAECLTALTENPGSVALLPQPFVTTAMIKNEGIRVALDLNAEWDKLDNGSSLITGVVVGRKEFIESYPAVINEFLAGYDASVGYVNSDTDGAAALIGKYDIVPEAVAKKALPACNIVFIDGTEMKEKLSGYLQVLFDSDPKSVGGKTPAEDFYFIG